MKIIFLDIDGVLNTSETNKKIPKEQRKYGIIGIEETKVQILKRIIEETNAKIVLNSIWNLDFRKEGSKIIAENEKALELLKKLKKYNLEIYDITPEVPNHMKKNQIEAWLTNHPNIITFVIIDDEIADLITYYKNNQLVKTNFFPSKEQNGECGLCERQADEAIKILNKVKIIPKQHN